MSVDNPQMNRLQRSTTNMVFSSVGYVVPMIVNLLTVPILLNLLGEAAYGLQTLVTVIIGYFTVMDMGLDLPLIKFVAEDHALGNRVAGNHLLSTTLQLYAFVGLVGMCVVFFSAGFLAQSVFTVPDELVDEARQVFQLAGLGFLGSMGMTWGRAVTKGMQRFDITYSVSTVTQLVAVGLGLGAVLLGYGVVGYVMLRVMVLFLAGATYWLLTMHFFPMFELSWGLDRTALHRIKAYVGYGMVNRAVGGVVGGLDKTLIGVWIGVAAAGIYSVPLMLVTSLSYMLAFMLGFISPMASELQSLDRMDRLRDIFIRSSQFIAAMAGLLFVPLFVLGDLFLALWAPTISSQAAGVLRILALAGYIGTLTATLPNNMMVGLGKMRQFTVYTSVRAVALTACFVALIRSLGIEGAGWAILITCGVDIVYLLVFLRRYIQVPAALLLKEAYLKPVLLGVVFGGLAFVCRPLAMSWPGFAGVGLGLTLIYILTAYTIGIIGETEKRAVVGLLKCHFPAA